LPYLINDHEQHRKVLHWSLLQCLLYDQILHVDDDHDYDYDHDRGHGHGHDCDYECYDYAISLYFTHDDCIYDQAFHGHDDLFLHVYGHACDHVYDHAHGHVHDLRDHENNCGLHVDQNVKLA